MNKQNSNNKLPLLNGSTQKVLMVIILLLLVSGLPLSAQIETVNFSGKYEDITIPTDPSIKFLTITALGGDGGRIKRDHTYKGGRGALVKATFEIGKGQGQLYPGGTIRFIVGGCGDGIDGKADADQKGVGGGGGTGVAYKDPDVGAPWRLLLVAAGGGGAHWFFGGGKDGRQGIKYDPADIGDGKAGVYHTEFGSSSKYSGAGAFGDSERIPAVGRSYAGWKGGPNTGEPTGGSGWDSGKSKYFSGGWGFGAGGLGTRHDYMAGGGGGYSGGIKSPSRSGGYGGHSYLNPDLNTPLVFTLERGTTISPKNGYVIYEYGKDSPVSAIHLAKDQTKCIDLTNGNTANGANIQLVQCKGNPAQQWVIDGATILLANHISKCLDLDQSNTANGTNIQLWDCNDTNAQNWIYDVANRMIRSKIDFSKCLDLVDGNTTGGTNIQLYDCVYGNNQPNQQWVVDGVPSALPTATNLQIHVVAAPNKCLDVSNYNTDNGTNIQLTECKDHPAQYFTFDGRAIKMQAHPDKCLDLSLSKTDNGKNIQLFDCNGTDAQNWIYDGFAKAFRSAIDLGKCLDVKESNFSNATNIQLWDCNGTDAQQFEIY